MALLFIPKRQYAILRKLVELTGDQFNALLAALGEIEASLSSHDFSKHLAEKVKTIPSDDIENIVQMLCNLYPAKEKNNKTAAQIAADLKETAEEDKPENFSLEHTGLLEERMGKLLNVDKAVAVTAKAHDVVTEHAHIFCGARILSDIRPVFSATADSVLAAVIVHTLNISYHSNGEHREFYAAMDKSDIDLLKKAIERAEKKSVALQDIMRKTELTYLEAGE